MDAVQGDGLAASVSSTGRFLALLAQPLRRLPQLARGAFM
jgi:hypothetical protein